MHRMLKLALPVALVAAACSTAPKSEEEKGELRNDVDATVAAFKEKDETMKKFFEDAAGWAVLPTIGKGGVGIGGAYGKGMVFKGGSVIGYCDMTQASIGFQLGGQAYSQIIFFKNGDKVTEFTTGNFEFSAQASAVAATAGVGATSDYENGMAVFTLAKGGLMYEASIAGQKFDYVAK